ncbi:hypothetical protein M231_05152 [Tremella mesenterica]|uniref:Glutamine amidotransferase type-2 domain-containing protein n=1 Tax=Tremella mesenterica TaxID=5217 RepID=A0A4Q1BIZ0_TREME|nr:hypothetical protein M231_05152 [Tremella mesenterica]
MCRWFTYLGEEPQLLEDLLLRPAHSITKQIDSHYLPAGHTLTNSPYLPHPAGHIIANRTSRNTHPAKASDKGSPNALTNMDGFGVGWWSEAFECYTTGISGDEALRPATYKNIRPPLNDLVLASMARAIETKAVVAHVRATSATPVVETNCHPFSFGRHLFCHNGVLGSFPLFRVKLLSLLPERYQGTILGTSDSEHIAALYFFHLCGPSGDWNIAYPLKSMIEAMSKTIKVLERMKTEAENKHGVEPEHNALNLLVNSGSSLVALRYASPITREPPSLYYSTTAGATLNRKFKDHPDHGVEADGRDKEEHGRHVIVASEPNTYNADEWEIIQPGEVVSVEKDMEVRKEMLEV